MVWAEGTLVLLGASSSLVTLGLGDTVHLSSLLPLFSSVRKVRYLSLGLCEPVSSSVIRVMPSIGSLIRLTFLANEQIIGANLNLWGRAGYSRILLGPLADFRTRISVLPRYC